VVQGQGRYTAGSFFVLGVEPARIGMPAPTASRKRAWGNYRQAGEPGGTGRKVFIFKCGKLDETKLTYPWYPKKNGPQRGRVARSLPDTIIARLAALAF
jgi:hypothetical protein